MSKANSLYHIELNHPDSKWHKEGHQGSSPALAIEENFSFDAEVFLF